MNSLNKNNILIPNFIKEANRIKLENAYCENPNSRLFHITTTYDQSRFGASNWTQSIGVKRHEKIDNVVSDLIFKNRKFYIEILKTGKFDYRRKRSIKYQPLTIGYFHDDESRPARPHSHAILLCYDDDIILNLRSGNAECLWQIIEPTGKLHIREFNIEQLAAVNGYASTYYVKRSTSFPAEHLMFQFPQIYMK